MGVVVGLVKVLFSNPCGSPSNKMIPHHRVWFWPHWICSCCYCVAHSDYSCNFDLYSGTHHCSLHILWLHCTRICCDCDPSCPPGRCHWHTQWVGKWYQHCCSSAAPRMLMKHIHVCTHTYEHAIIECIHNNHFVQDVCCTYNSNEKIGAKVQPLHKRDSFLRCIIPG